MELQTLRSALEVAKEKDQKVQAEEEHERVEAAFTSFFGTLLVICLVLALLWMHNRHQQETASVLALGSVARFGGRSVARSKACTVGRMCNHLQLAK
eukprot:g2783.t1